MLEAEVGDVIAQAEEKVIGLEMARAKQAIGLDDQALRLVDERRTERWSASGLSAATSISTGRSDVSSGIALKNSPISTGESTRVVSDTGPELELALAPDRRM